MQRIGKGLQRIGKGLQRIAKDWIALHRVGLPCIGLDGLVDAPTTRLSTDYKTFNRLQDFQQITRVPGLNIVHKAPTRRLIKKKVAEGHLSQTTRVSPDYKTFNRLQEFQQTTKVSTDYKTSNILQYFQQITRLSTDHKSLSPM